MLTTIDFDSIVLSRGTHDTFDKGVCAIELASVLGGESFSDHPDCVCCVYASYVRSLNDKMDDFTRQFLKPYISRLIGTRSTSEVEQKRIETLVTVRRVLPVAFRAAEMESEAIAFESISDDTSMEEICIITRVAEFEAAVAHATYAASRQHRFAAASATGVNLAAAYTGVNLAAAYTPLTDAADYLACAADDAAHVAITNADLVGWESIPWQECIEAMLAVK